MANVTISATVHHRPNGKKEVIDVSNVYEDDAVYINTNSIKVSMEDTGISFVLYFDYGHEDDDGEPIEHIELSDGRSCHDTIKTAVEKIKTLIPTPDGLEKT